MDISGSTTTSGGGKTRSLHEILAAKQRGNGGVGAVSVSTTNANNTNLPMSIDSFASSSNNLGSQFNQYHEDMPVRPLGSSKKELTNNGGSVPNSNPFDDMPIRPAAGGNIGYNNLKNHDDHSSIESSLTLQHSDELINRNLDNRQPEEDEEAEMPSSSLTVLGDNTNLLQLLAGASISPSYLTPSAVNNTNASTFYNTIPHTSSFVPGSPAPATDANTHQQYGKSSTTESSLNEDMIELYSTISMLKKENSGLLKEIEFVKKSKDAIIQENSIKSEQHIQRLKLELQEQQQYNISHAREKEDLQRELELMKVDMEFLIKQKEDIEQNIHRKQDDSSTLKTELLTMKTELNKIKMENSRYKSENEKLSYESQQATKELKDLRQHIEEEDRRQENMIKDLQGNIRKLEEINLAIKNELTEKNTQIGRMMSDWMSLERNFKNAVMDNDNLKQRMATLESTERELNQARYHMSTLENDYRNLQTEIGNLRNQLQQQQHIGGGSGIGGSSVRSSYNSIPPPPTSSYIPSTPQRAPPTSSFHHDSYSNYGSNSSRMGPGHSISSYGGGRYGDDEYSKPSYGYGDPPGSSMNNVIGGSVGSGKSAPKSLSSALGEVTELRRNVGVPANDGRQSNQSSLANLLQGRKGSAADDQPPISITGEGRRKPLGQALGGGSGATPFATEKTSEMMSSFDSMERDLTRYMTEKNTLMEESEKLQVRGLKSLADRTRLQKVDSRLEELNKEISTLRKKLSGKPA